jgi:hypothetical protein
MNEKLFLKILKNHCKFKFRAVDAGYNNDKSEFKRLCVEVKSDKIVSVRDIIIWWKMGKAKKTKENYQNTNTKGTTTNDPRAV